MRAQALRSAAQQVGASHLLSPAGLAQSVPDTRCALLQVLFYEFCDAQGITDFYPVGAPLFSNFLSSCRESSVGSKGGVTVEHSLKVAFSHMHTHLAFDISLDVPCLFNAIKPYKGDSDTAQAFAIDGNRLPHAEKYTV